jgi:hypothetical protein
MFIPTWESFRRHTHTVDGITAQPSRWAVGFWTTSVAKVFPMLQQKWNFRIIWHQYRTLSLLFINPWHSPSRWQLQRLWKRGKDFEKRCVSNPGPKLISYKSEDSHTWNKFALLDWRFSQARLWRVCVPFSVTLLSLVQVYRRFVGSYCLHFQNPRKLSNKQAASFVYLRSWRRR